MDDLLGALPNYAAGGVSAGAGFFIFKWFFEWLSGRIDKREAGVVAREAIIDASTQALIHNLEDRMTRSEKRTDQVETELNECREQHSECEAKYARLEAMMQGYGEAKDLTQRMIARDRLADREGKKE